MKAKAVIPLVLGLCVGLIAVKLLVDTLREAKASGRATQTVQAVRAKVDINAYTKVTPEMVELVETADVLFAPASQRISSLEDLEDRVTVKFVPAGSPLLQSMLAPPGTPAGMEGRIPPGYRAVSVKIDEVTGVAYQLQPGDWVDVIVVMDIDSGGRRRTKETIAEVILQNIQVAAIGRHMAGQDEAGSQVKPAKSATLLIPEREVPKLHLAQTRGKITLSMRGSDDTAVAAPAKAHSGELFGDGKSGNSSDSTDLTGERWWQSLLAANTGNAQPEMAPQPPHGVTVYRRSKARGGAAVAVERITFENAGSWRIIDVGDTPVNRAERMMSDSFASPSPTWNRPGTPGWHEAVPTPKPNYQAPETE